MTFSENNYYRNKFTGLSLAESRLVSKVFEECEFTGCMFITCKLEKCKFIGCKFNECILSAVDPVDCRFMEASFVKCKAIGIDWTRTAQVQDLSFDECQINYSVFKLLKIPGLKLVNCEAKEVEFAETDLARGDFRNTDFERSIFFKTNLTEADFTGARNYSIDVKLNTIKKARFSYPEVLSLLHSLDIIIV